MPVRDPHGWMWEEALAMIERAEHLHRRFFEPVFSSSAAVWEPPIDVFETDHEVWIVIALPGAELDDLDVSVDADSLRIAGHRRLPSSARDAVVHRIEIPCGRFERRIRLPSARLALGRSELVNGCLVLTLAKTD